jgi:hypothetical protein
MKAWIGLLQLWSLLFRLKFITLWTKWDETPLQNQLSIITHQIALGVKLGVLKECLNL